MSKEANLFTDELKAAFVVKKDSSESSISDSGTTPSYAKSSNSHLTKSKESKEDVKPKGAKGSALFANLSNAF